MSRKPVIVLNPRLDKDIHQIPNRGGGEKVFEVNLTERRQFLINSFNRIKQELNPQFIKYQGFPQVIKITVRGDAIAKSHRPDDFLRRMKILTYGLPTEIYVAVTANDLLNTISDCETRNTNKFNANISSIVDVQSLLPNNKKVIINELPKHDIVIKTLDYDDEKQNKISERLLENTLRSYNLEQHIITVGNKAYSRVIKNISIDEINALKDLPFVFSIRELVDVCQANSEPTVLGPFKPIRDYILNDGIIAVVDSGISDDVIDKKYIYAKEIYIPKEYQDNTHGTFVASTILFGNEMNDRPEINPTTFKLLDVVALTSAEKGMPINECEFCECLRDAVEKHHNQVKVWNLSIGFPNILASDEAISDVGSFCDYLQKEYDVQFFISSGNYVNMPRRIWPVPIGSDDDRITSPADSLMAISVGSLAEKECPGSLSRFKEPSAFSRRGPGACSLFKPDLTDYGGNMLADVTWKNIGVIGLDLNGNRCELIGTSFSAPLVSYKFSKIYSLLEKKDLLLAKTLLVHNALRNSPNIIGCEKEQRKYYGFGQPSNDCEYTLDCSDNEITMVLECELSSGTMVDIQNFPFPKTMIVDGKCKGEIFATLVSNPSFNKRFGSEYSRIDFNLSIGTYSFKEDEDGIDYSRQVEPLKPGNNKYRFENELIEEDLKWSPIKTYHRKFKEGTDVKDGWRVSVQLHSRFQEPINRHKCYVAITFIGDSNTIYDEMVETIRSEGFIVNNIDIVTEIKNPIKS